METLSVSVIESSSNGNSIILYDGQTYLFLDYGSSSSNIKTAYEIHGIDLKQIAGILISHYHIDHIRSIGKQYIPLNVFLTNETYLFLRKKGYDNYKPNIVNNYIGRWVKINGTNWRFKPFFTIHNAKESICFIIKNKRKTLLYLTDTKYFYNKRFKNLNGYIIEAPFGHEYDVNNKQKIKINLEKEQNHLKLHESVDLFEKYVGKKTKLFVFSHINPKVQNFELIENICNNKKRNNKLVVDYIKPKQINKRVFHL